MVAWCRLKNIYVISDEIYAVSVNKTFYSLYKEADCVVWGLSKDVCASGMRCSVVYSKDKWLMENCLTLCMPYAVSGVAQVIFAQILEDNAFLDQFFESMRKDLNDARSDVMAKLDALQLPYVGKADFAGMFLWVDLSSVGGSDSIEIFSDLLENYKVFLTPGEPFFDRESGEALDVSRYGMGWMRICFAASNAEARAEGLRRLERYVRDKRD